jgi:hypothetical protein
MIPGAYGTHRASGAPGTLGTNLIYLFSVIKFSFILMNIETVNLNTGFYFGPNI